MARGEHLWGLHNYRDSNPRRGQRYGGTKLLLKTVPGKVWLTETGGIVRFVLPDGRTLFPYSERRANVAIGRVLRLARQYRSRIERLYVYHWRQDAFDNRFDAGLLNRNGEPRPSYLHAQALAQHSLVHTVTSGWRVRRCSPSVSRTQRRSSGARHPVAAEQLLLALERQPGDLPAHGEPLEQELRRGAASGPPPRPRAWIRAARAGAACRRSARRAA